MLGLYFQGLFISKTFFHRTFLVLNFKTYFQKPFSKNFFGGYQRLGDCWSRTFISLFTNQESWTECKQILIWAALFVITFLQGIEIKGKEKSLVWHEKASRTALQTSTVNFTHTILVQTHNMIAVKEIAKQCVNYN